MKHHPRLERLYLQDIPEEKVASIEQAVNSGIALLRANLKVRTKVDFHILLLIERGVLSRGRASKRGIAIGVTQRFLKTRNFKKELRSTAIHEYVHFLRLQSGRHDARTVLGVIVEEGIAIYVQTMLAARPSYLLARGPSDADLRMYWSKFSEVANQPSRKYPQLVDNDAYRAAGYRLGFGLARDFMDSHPGMTLLQLARISGKRLARFAERRFAPGSS